MGEIIGKLEIVVPLGSSTISSKECSYDTFSAGVRWVGRSGCQMNNDFGLDCDDLEFLGHGPSPNHFLVWYDADFAL